MINLKIKISKREHDIYVADMLNLPGCPPVGYGKNKYEAVGSLLYEITKEKNWASLLGVAFEFSTFECGD